MTCTFSTKKSDCWILLSSSLFKSISWNSISTLSQSHTSNSFKSGHLEVNLPKQNLWSWGKALSVREVSLGNKNKDVASSSFSLATIASSTSQKDIFRSSSCTRTFATERGKTFSNSQQQLTSKRFSLEKEFAGSWLCHNAFRLFRNDTPKDSKAGNATYAIDDPFG